MLMKSISIFFLYLHITIFVKLKLVEFATEDLYLKKFIERIFSFITLSPISW